MWLSQAAVLALAVSLAHTSPTELLWSRAESSTCGTQAVTASVAALKTGTAHPLQFCQFYTSGNRVRSPFIDIPVSVLQTACRCILADVTSTVSSSKTPSTSAQAVATSASTTPIKSVKSAYKDYMSFCTFYVAYPRSESTIPGLSAAQAEKACKSILASESTSSLASTTKSTFAGSSTVSASSTSKISSEVSSRSTISSTLSETSSAPHSSTSTSSTQTSTSFTPAATYYSSSYNYLLAQNAGSYLSGNQALIAESPTEQPGFNFPYWAIGGTSLQYYTLDPTTGYAYNSAGFIMGVRVDSQKGYLPIYGGGEDDSTLIPLTCITPNASYSLLDCSVTYNNIVYSQFVYDQDGVAWFLGLSQRGNVPSEYYTLDLQLIPQSVGYSPGSGE